MRSAFLLSLLLLAPANLSAAEPEVVSSHRIVIDFSDISLCLFDGDKPVASYPVALPRVTPKLPATGRVVRVIKDPVWYPTESTRRYYFRKKGVELPQRIEPGSKLNAMGQAKLIIVFESGDINHAVRVHGTNDPTSIGKRVSRGCIRMRNEDILALSSLISADLLSGKSIPIVFAP